MKKNRTIAIAAAALLAAAMLLALTFGDRGLLDVYRLHKRDKALTGEIAAANAQIDSLKAEVRRLRSDTSYITKIARESLGMAKPGEKVYIFVTEDKK
ncbi:MAG: septum formation initiator family protein [Chitinispirillia bacterium]|nr:septum formation initiator family protein [Chitinispirillia bacterium]